MKIVWLSQALQSLEDEANYLSDIDIELARNFIKQVENSIDRLKEFPSSGIQGRISGTRELIMLNLPYIIPYRVVHDEIQILRVFHTRRQLPKKW